MAVEVGEQAHVKRYTTEVHLSTRLKAMVISHSRKHVAFFPVHCPVA